MRALDGAWAAIEADGALLLVAPLMLVIAAGVKLSSPGPVIYKQRRNGLDGDIHRRCWDQAQALVGMGTTVL